MPLGGGVPPWHGLQAMAKGCRGDSGGATWVIGEGKASSKRLLGLYINPGAQSLFKPMNPKPCKGLNPKQKLPQQLPGAGRSYLQVGA